MCCSFLVWLDHYVLLEIGKFVLNRGSVNTGHAVAGWISSGRVVRKPFLGTPCLGLEGDHRYIQFDISALGGETVQGGNFEA